jgi:hypothetical protein
VYNLGHPVSAKTHCSTTIASNFNTQQYFIILPAASRITGFSLNGENKVMKKAIVYCRSAIADEDSEMRLST